MKDHLQLKRLWLLIKKQGYENLRLYLLATMTLTILLCVALIFWLATSWGEFYESGMYYIFYWGLFLGGTIFAGHTFHMFETKEKGLYWLSFPASHLEKLVTAILYTLVMFTLVYSSIFFLLKTIFWNYANFVVQDSAEMKMYPLNALEPDTGVVFPKTYLLKIFFAVQAFYLLGSLYFSRFSFLKTTITGAILFFLCLSYFNFLTDTFSGFDLNGTLTIWDGEDTEKIASLPGVVRKIIYYAGTLIWAPLFWIVSYYRLKEKEI